LKKGTGAVDVGVVTSLCLVLDVRGVDGDTTRLLFRGLVDLVVGQELDGALGAIGQNLGDGGGQRGLAVIDVTCRRFENERNERKERELTMREWGEPMVPTFM
jgi:hypothetical protein